MHHNIAARKYEVEQGMVELQNFLWRDRSDIFSGADMQIKCAPIATVKAAVGAPQGLP
jgi:hypothetical protein